MHQGKVVVGIGVLMGLDGLRALEHHWAKDLVLVEPVGKEMHTRTRQMGRGLDDLRPTGARRAA
jgi:hypothetical protein